MAANSRFSTLALLAALVGACGGEASPGTSGADATDDIGDPGDTRESDAADDSSPGDTSDATEPDATEPDAADAGATDADATSDVTPDVAADVAPDAAGDVAADAPTDATDATNVTDATDDAADATDASDTEADATSDAGTDAVSDAGSDAPGDALDALDVPDVTATGPQLIGSSVVNGQIGASRSLGVTLRFDRPIPLTHFEGNVFATSEGVPARTPMVATGCPDAPGDLACVVVTFAAPFVQPGTGALYPATYHTVIVTRDLADEDGIANDDDTLLTFSTEGSLVLYDGSAATLDASGIAYDPHTRSLFFTETPPAELGLPAPATIRRIRDPDGLVGAPTTFAEVFPTTQSTWFSELDAVDGRLYVSLPYDENVRIFDNLRIDGASSTRMFTGTSLPAPDQSLRQVVSVAVLDGGARHLFGFGSFLATDRPTALAQRIDGAWSLFGTGRFSNVDEFFVTAREDVLPGLVFVAAGGELVALSSTTGERVNAHPWGSARSMGRLAIDSAGRLYSKNADPAPLVVFDPSGDAGFATLATLDLGDRDRFAISERGNVITVYSLAFRRAPVVVRDRILLCDGDAPCVSSCDDRERDGTETAIDCGGTCDPCPFASACVADSDCASGNCDAGLCGERRPNGCSDGTREGFVDAISAPTIAGCSGAWDVAGVVDSVEPSCARQAGNDGARPDGVGCGAVDLCAEGWHICSSPLAVQERAPGGTCDEVTRGGDGPLFFATAVRSGGSGECLTPLPGIANDIFGCGNIGAPTPGSATCGPLDRFSGDLCASLAVLPGFESWLCGADGTREGFNVTHAGDFDGGVLCCAGCTPICADRMCGDDGCGGSCGECPLGLPCSPAGLCEF